MSVASAERVANKTSADALVQAIIQNPILRPNYTVPIEREDKFIPAKRGWFDFLKAKTNHLGDIKVWFKKVVEKNGYLKKFGTNLIDTIAALSLNRLKYLRSICENQVEGTEEESIMDLNILKLPGKNNGHVHVHVYKMKAWVDCESSVDMGGITYEYTKYSFTAREQLVNKISPAAKEKAVEVLKCFLGNILGPRPNDGTATTKATTQRPTTTMKPTTTASGNETTTKTKPTVTAHLEADC